MQHSKPVVTIDLAEYNELLEKGKPVAGEKEMLKETILAYRDTMNKFPDFKENLEKNIAERGIELSITGNDISVKQVVPLAKQ